jgi:hypothetical protein
VTTQQGIKDARKRAQNIRIAGAVVFLIGAIPAGLGTTSIALLIVYVLISFGGLGVVAFGQSEYRKTLG